jgi:hypothetical protein
MFFPVGKIGEPGLRKFPSDGEEIIREHKSRSRRFVLDGARRRESGSGKFSAENYA